MNNPGFQPRDINETSKKVHSQWLIEIQKLHAAHKQNEIENRIKINTEVQDKLGTLTSDFHLRASNFLKYDTFR
jgi:hypothetical protein